MLENCFVRQKQEGSDVNNSNNLMHLCNNGKLTTRKLDDLVDDGQIEKVTLVNLM